MQKVKGLRTAGWLLQNSPGGVKYSPGNRVSDTALTVCGARGALEILGRPVCKVCDYLTTMLPTRNSYKLILKINCN